MTYRFDKHLATKINYKMASTYSFVPVSEIGGVLNIYISDKSDQSVDNLEFLLGMKVQVIKALDEKLIIKMLDEMYLDTPQKPTEPISTDRIIKKLRQYPSPVKACAADRLASYQQSREKIKQLINKGSIGRGYLVKLIKEELEQNK